MDVNLSGQAARAFEPAPTQNGHAAPAQVPTRLNGLDLASRQELGFF